MRLWPRKRKTEPKPEKTYPPGTKTITVYPYGGPVQTWEIQTYRGQQDGFLTFVEKEGTLLSVRTSLFYGWSVKDW